MQVDKWRTRRLIFGLALVFSLPAFSAWYLFFHGDHRSLRASNNGELIHSPFQLSELSLTDYKGDKVLNKSHKWAILYWTKSCDKTCKQVVEKLLRVRVVLGKDMLRTQAWLATDKDITGQMLEQLTNVQGLDTQAMHMPKSEQARKLLGEKAILLVDPSGNVMMRYAEDAPPKAINNDLKQLLKLSRMG
tara:strand:+ start:253 stop:822 length:570 start_codon:yes stop_codon:yes gene_type:complete